MASRQQRHLMLQLAGLRVALAAATDERQRAAYEEQIRVLENLLGPDLAAEA